MSEAMQPEIEPPTEALPLQALIDALPQICWTTPAMGGAAFCNGRFFEYTGISFEEVLGAGWARIVHPDDLAGCIASRRESLERGTSWEYEYRLRRHDEMYRWFLARAEPVRDPLSGRIINWVGTATDITERHETERLLREAKVTMRREIEERRHAQEMLSRRERDYATLVDNAPDVLARFDRNFHFSYINRQAERNTGIPTKAFLGRTFREIGGLPEETILLWEQAITEVFTTGEPRHIEYSFPTPDGLGYFECELVPEFAPEARTVNTVVTVTRNITDRKLLEIEREAQRKAQSRFLREMISSLTEGRLRLCESASDLPQPLTPASEVVDLSVTNLRVLRQRVREITERLEFPEARKQDIQTAVGEGAMNAYVHAGGGTGWVCVDQERGVVQVWIKDGGKGIAEEALPKVLEKGMSTAGTLGHGFSIMLNTAQRIYLLTGASGTTIVLEQERSEPDPTWLYGS